MTVSDALVYFEVDTIGNVRHLHTDAAVHGVLGAGDLGGYSYTAFGKTIAPSDAGGVTAPVGVTQPFGWQGKRLIAPNLYDSRARVWSADLGAFLQPDEYVFLGRSGTLWSWPGQNPYRWRDPSGRYALTLGYAFTTFPGWIAGSFAAGFAVGYALAPYTSEKLADLLNNNKADEEADLAKWQKQNADAIAKAASNRKPCAGGSGASKPPVSSSNTTADAPDPRNPRHHIFPQQYRAEFEKAGIDIDEYTIEMSQDEHQGLHSEGWNQEWGDFFDETPNPSVAQIRSFASDLLNQVGLANRPIVPFY